jgi:cytochrome c oxidase assembly protein subunit 15
MSTTPASAWLALLALASAGALVPLVWVAWRWRGQGARARLAGLTVVTLFLTLDLIAVGAFTRLTDSGLGCPDWPGCYASAHPWAAQAQIEAAQAQQPQGPVTWEKAWIEMLHRYLAMTVGALLLVLAVASAALRRHLPHAVWWPWATLAWVVVQGLFGKYTVTWKLYPAIVTLHLLGAVVLLAMLVRQREAFRGPPGLALPQRLRCAVAGALGLLLMQVTLGAWVSTNYAVLACSGFPQCNGQWWPAEAAFGQGYTVLRELGRTAMGDYLPASALVAIHWGHRVLALAVVLLMSALVLALWRQRGLARRYARGLIVLMLWQVASGVGNVVWQWPLAAALMHTLGAACWVAWLVSLLARSRAAPALAVVASNTRRTQRATPAKLKGVTP